MLAHLPPRVLSCALLALLTTLTCTPAIAQQAPSPPDVNQQLLDTLLHNGAITQAQYQHLTTQEHRRQEKIRSTPVKPAVANTTAAPRTSTASIKIGGRIQADAGFFDSDRNRIGNGQELRRARIDISGKIYHDWAYSLSYDFAGSGAIQNANLSYLAPDHTTLTFGYYKLPFSLEYQTSNNYTEFQERSLLHDAFDPPKRIGLGVEHHGHGSAGDYVAAAGVFGEAVPSDRGEGSSGVGVTARLADAFVHSDRRLLHLGLDASWRHPGSDEGTRLQARPGAHLASRLIDTAAIDNVRNDLKLGGEFAAIRGRLALQGQYTAETIHRTTGNLHFDGWYAQASYFLTDDSRAGAYSGGHFGGITPHTEGGAWQLALRYDTVDLIDGAFNGGQENNLSAALNWYVNKTIRFSADYVRVLRLRRPGSMYGGDTPSMLIARMWLIF